MVDGWRRCWSPYDVQSVRLSGGRVSLLIHPYQSLWLHFSNIVSIAWPTTSTRCRTTASFSSSSSSHSWHGFPYRAIYGRHLLWGKAKANLVAHCYFWAKSVLMNEETLPKSMRIRIWCFPTAVCKRKVYFFTSVDRGSESLANNRRSQNMIRFSVQFNCSTRSGKDLEKLFNYMEMNFCQGIMCLVLAITTRES